MKTILMTNAYIKDFTGSEIDTVTLGNYFTEMGYFVDIFTLEKGFPLLDIVNKNVRVLDYSDNEKLLNEYDYVWAHHFPLLDYLIFHKKIRAKYIHYVSLSSYANFEAYPEYYQDLSLISILSKEAKKLSIEEGYDGNIINIFPNYIQKKELMDHYIDKSNNIQKVCIVSNHVPQELEDTKTIFESKGIQLDIYGKNHIYKIINAQLLSTYDVVVSIGKTVNLAIALGIPCYVYDHFGGDGYITKDNIKNSFDYNFSGRYLKKTQTREEIVSCIINEYNNCLKDLEYCKLFARDNFLLENQVDKAMNQMHKKPMNYLNLFNKYKTLERKAPLFVTENGRRQIALDSNKRYLQIYYSLDLNFTEERSFKVDIINNKINYVSDLFHDKMYFRIDLLDKGGYKINNFKINDKPFNINDVHHNGLYKISDYLITTNNDPWIIIGNLNQFHIKYDIVDVRNETINNYIQSKYINNSDFNFYPKYVKGIFRPYFVIQIPGVIMTDLFLFEGNGGKKMYAGYYYSLDNNITYVYSRIKSRSIRCYYLSDLDEKELIFEYKYSLFNKIKNKLFG